MTAESAEVNFVSRSDLEAYAAELGAMVVCFSEQLRGQLKILNEKLDRVAIEEDECNEELKALNEELDRIAIKQDELRSMFA